jgi:hypothetical protein
MPCFCAGRGIVDFIARELEKNVAEELRVDDVSSVPEKLSR